MFSEFLPYMPSLDGAFAKLHRAEKHLKIASGLVRWFARNKCSVRREINTETNTVDGYAIMDSPPTRIAMILGDAIHNMRSALDHAVYELVISNPDPNKPTGVPNDKTMFPICDTRPGFLRQVNELGRIKGVPDDACKIIGSAQPLNLRERGLDHRANPLWILNKLENIDKHRRFTVVAGAVIGHVAKVTRADGLVLDFVDGAPNRQQPTIIRDGGKVFSLPLLKFGKGEADVKGTLFSTVTFNEPELGPTAQSEACGICWRIFDVINDKLIPDLAACIL